MFLRCLQPGTPIERGVQSQEELFSHRQVRWGLWLHSTSYPPPPPHRLAVMMEELKVGSMHDTKGQTIPKIHLLWVF